LDRFIQEIGDIHRPVLATQHPIWNTFALDIFTLVVGRISVVIVVGARTASIQIAVKGFLVLDPD
jgi:hypothetical protein